uniref:Uncharacterized protein n=1 Tax=Ditylenchus dipsaci TaxID=166011 RepID=A0A915DMG1_9BILA
MLSLHRTAFPRLLNTISYTSYSASFGTGNADTKVKNWIHGKPVDSKTSEWIDLTNPATNDVIGKCQ